MKEKRNITIIDKKQIPSEEPARQYYFMDIAKKYVAELAEQKGAPLTFCVTTFGCQMNARDSEKLVGILEQIGYVEAPDEKADFVIYNTCTVRENANNKVYGRLGYLHGFKKKNPYMMIGLCGCMMQEPTVVEKIQNSYRFVDLIFGTHNIYKFAELIVTALESDSMTIDIWKDTDKIVEDLPVERKYSFKSGVNIMFGCNNFCSYCIVPYVRGRERSREPKEIVRDIAESKSVLEDVQFADDKLILTYSQDASTHLYVYSIDGKELNEITLPTVGRAYVNSKRGQKECFYSFSSFTVPGTIYQYDIAENKSTVYTAPKIKFDLDKYTTQQVFVTSKDGTRVPMFLTYKKDLKRNGKNPVLIYGYGGFNVSLPPSFSSMRIPFLENGGIYAQVNLRGGSEYGEEWHVAGTKMQKQNVFDDFISSAEWLITNNFTSKDHIAIMGGSNGGLLVGACMTQRPDLFKVCIPQVGVMDMLRYHKFTIGWNWAPD